MCDLARSPRSVHQLYRPYGAQMNLGLSKGNTLICRLVTLGAALCYSLTTHTSIRRLVTCSPGKESLVPPLRLPELFEQLQLYSVTSPQTETQVPVPIFMWFPNNLGLPTVPHKNVEGAITLQQFDGWKDRWADS